jgi:hypothetical protein
MAVVQFVVAVALSSVATMSAAVVLLGQGLRLLAMSGKQGVISDVLGY